MRQRGVEVMGHLVVGVGGNRGAKRDPGGGVSPCSHLVTPFKISSGVARSSCGASMLGAQLVFRAAGRIITRRDRIGGGTLDATLPNTQPRLAR